MKKTKAIVVKESAAPAVQTPEQLISQAIMQKVDVATMEKLLAMRRELKAEKAKEEYDRAMAKFQSECPTIAKTKPGGKTNSGQVVYYYAPIESIVAQVKNALQDNGFSYTTGMELKEGGVRVTVKVTHAAGHSEETSMEVPFGTKTNAMSESQVAAAATTFAKRYAFCNAFGILTGDEDTDAQPQGTGSHEQRNRPGASFYEKAADIVGRMVEEKSLNEAWKKIATSSKYTDEEKEKLEGVIAARVEAIKKDIPQS
ncbi:MAG: ERF family protein [Candidatus Limnocylindrales bacterium]